MANLTLNVGDFDSVKAALVSFLQAQGKFTEYDFEGSNTAALVDLLAYNTYTNLVHNNLAINEAFRQPFMQCIGQTVLNFARLFLPVCRIGKPFGSI